MHGKLTAEKKAQNRRTKLSGKRLMLFVFLFIRTYNDDDEPRRLSHKTISKISSSNANTAKSLNAIHIECMAGNRHIRTYARTQIAYYFVSTIFRVILINWDFCIQS